MASGSAVIGALRVVLGADTALFESGLKGAQKDLDAFHRRVTQVGSVIGVAIGGAAVSLTMSIKGAIDQADKLGKMAQSFGVPVEQLSALKHAADLSGVSIEEVGKAVGKMSRSMSEIAGGKAGGGAADAFRALGISVRGTDGALKSSMQVMEEISDKFAGMQDGAGKTALAISIFGRSGANLIPMLNQGGAGLRAMTKEAEELGLIIDSKTAKAAEDFNDNIRRLQLINSAFARQLAVELLPSLQLLSQILIDLTKDSDGVKRNVGLFLAVLERVSFEVFSLITYFRRAGDELKALGQVFEAFGEDFKDDWNDSVNQLKPVQDVLGRAALDAARQLKPLTDGIGTAAHDAVVRVRQAVSQLSPEIRAMVDSVVPVLSQIASSTGEVTAESRALADEADSGKERVTRLSAAMDNWNRVNEETGRQIVDLKTKFQDFNEQARMLRDHAEDAAKSVPKIVPPVIKAKNAFDEFVKSQAKAIATQQAEAMSVGFLAGAKENLRIIMQGEAVAQANSIRLGEKEQLVLTNLGNAAQAAAMQLAKATITQETLLPWQQYEHQLRELNALFPEGERAGQAYQIKMQKIAESTGMSWGAAATSISGSFNEIATSLTGSQSKIVKATQTFAAAAALINTLVAQSYALAGPFPYNLVAMALVAAKGAALVAAIKSFSAPKMATGGSFIVPGGVSGVDNQMVPLNLASGERVTVETAHEVARGRGGGGARDITIRLFGPIPRDYVQQIADGISDAVGDGMKIRVLSY